MIGWWQHWYVPYVKLRNKKGNKLQDFFKAFEVDRFFGQEGGINWDLMPYLGRLESIFHTENALTVVASHNKHRKTSRHQWGSIFTLAFGELTMQKPEMGVDDTGLGRWVWMKFTGCSGHVMRVILAYHLNHSKSHQLHTAYAFQREHFWQDQLEIYIRKAMLCDLWTFLCTCQANGEWLILFINTNENMSNGHMQWMLTEDKLGMREVAMAWHPDLPLMTMFWWGKQLGKVPINGCWATDDLPEMAAGWLVFHKCPGDHYYQMIDIDAKVLLGENLLWIVCPPAQCLSCQIPCVKEKYRERITLHLNDHKVLEKLQWVYANVDCPLSPAQIKEVEHIDQVWAEGMTVAEKQCQKLAMGEVHFSPKVELAQQQKCLWTNIVHYNEAARWIWLTSGGRLNGVG